MTLIAVDPQAAQKPASRPLWQHFEKLASSLPACELARLPTPVTELTGLAGGTEARIFVKRDDLSGEPYGGNKVRKLEFLMAEAISRGCREVLTFGVAGSNHALATAVCAARLGLRSISVLTPQTNARYVAKNLLMSYAAGAELHYYRTQREADAGAQYQLLRHKRLTGHTPYVIAGGGSSPLGTLGFVNAGLELAGQIRAGELPEPDMVYVALGTMGTVVGLTLGLRAGGVASRVIAVRVVHENIANQERMQALADSVCAELRQRGADMPSVVIGDLGVTLRHDCFGAKYAVFTQQGMDAMARAARHDLKLEGTYTGKAFAAVLHDLDNGTLNGKTALFWNTYNSEPQQPWIEGLDYRDLPAAFHWYFTQPVQRLDRTLA